jgi:cytochrome c2
MKIQLVRRWIILSLGVLQLQFSAPPILAQSEEEPTAASAEVSPDSGTEVADAAPADGIPGDPALISEGETLFTNYCKQCHAVHEQVIGPALAGVTERQSIDWLTRFIINSQQVIQSGDDYAVKLYEEYNQLLMPPHDFTDDQVLSILAYVKDESSKGPAETAASTDTTAVEGQPQTGVGVSSDVLTVFLIALLVVLLLILVVLFMLVSVLRKYLQQKAGISDEDRAVVQGRTDLKKLAQSPAVIWFVAFIFTAIVLKSVIDGLFTVGIQQDYAPTQPIAFSHKLHAGDYAIDCQYCHTGVMESASANIPSANICMNCHQSIVKITGSDELSVEIQKISDAINNNQPIEWVRVHNLPDLAYFNHAQHYNVGGIECQTCHGPIEEMEVVAQQENLTMGWCIDCHRTNAVNAKDNAYYDKLVELHSSTSQKPLTVEDIGGLECSKCHY